MSQKGERSDSSRIFPTKQLRDDDGVLQSSDDIESKILTSFYEYIVLQFKQQTINVIVSFGRIHTHSISKHEATYNANTLDGESCEFCQCLVKKFPFLGS